VAEAVDAQVAALRADPGAALVDLWLRLLTRGHVASLPIVCTRCRWVNHASRLALAGHVRAAVACLRHAARWSPRAVAPLAARRIAWFAAVRYREWT
jgi:hypothetical protein